MKWFVLIAHVSFSFSWGGGGEEVPYLISWTGPIPRILKQPRKKVMLCPQMAKDLHVAWLSTHIH